MFCLVLCHFPQIGYYKSVTAMAKDIDLMAKNAKTYNEPGSQVFKVISLPSLFPQFQKETQLLSLNKSLFCHLTGCKHHKESLHPEED